MKKNLVLFACAAVLLCTAFSCEKKNSSTAISPDYSATGNPNPNNQTVTGSNTYTNPATENSSLIVGDIGWSNPSCITTGSTSLRGTKGTTEVVLTFLGAATDGTYAITSQAAANSCALLVLNAPNQPAGVLFYGRSGTVVVSTSTSNITGKLMNAVCTQSTFNFPIVSVSGNLSCNQ
jgi:hypothetical protein